MFAMYGVCSHTLSHTRDQLAPIASKLGLGLKVAGMPTPSSPLPDFNTFRNEWRSAHVALFPGLRELRAWAPLMERAPLVGVVHDSPLLLNEIKGLRFLDTTPEGNGFSFRLSALDLRPMQSEILRAKARKGEHAPLEIARQIDLMPTIIDQEREGQFLDKYNNLLYRCTGAAIRAAVRRSVVLYLFGYIPRTALTTQVLRHIPARGFAQETFQEMMVWLATDDGKRLMQALAEIRKLKSEDVSLNYPSICKRHGVERYEIHYLNLMLRRETNHAKPQTMREATAQARSNHAKKLAVKAGISEAA